MRRFAILFTGLALVLSGLVFSPAQAEDTTGDTEFLRWSDDGTNVTITGCYADTCPTSITIPATIEISSGNYHTVTSIGYQAFARETILTSVTFTSPNSLVSIGDSAFEDATALTSITIPASVTEIGDYAFGSATSLTTVIFDGTSTLTLIKLGTFDGATALTSITIPASVTSIDDAAFADATALQSVTFTSPSALESIGASAFLGATALTSITIPASVTSIGDSAFEDATALTSINIPASVTSIGDYAFAGTSSLTRFAVEAGSTSYKATSDVLFTYNGFTLVAYPAGKTETDTSYAIPGGVTRIEIAAFSDATALTSITIPAGVTSIGDEAFYGASALTSITIPASVTSIDDAAFANATALQSVTFTSPSSLVSIRDSAFEAASALTSITIPASVTSVGDYAFDGATALTSVYFLGNAPTVGNSAFANVASSAKAYIKTCATGFADVGQVWNGLIVTVWTDCAASPVPVIANGYRADKLGTVYFAPRSSKLSKAAKKQIKKLVTANPIAIYKVSGYVQKSIFAKNAKNDASLSLARAKAVETYLASLGAGVNFTVVIDAGKVPTKNGKSSKARRATLYAMTPVVQ